MRIMRIGGVITVLAIVAIVVPFWLRRPREPSQVPQHPNQFETWKPRPEV
jgi:hypothetical protein